MGDDNGVRRGHLGGLAGAIVLTLGMSAYTQADIVGVDPVAEEAAAAVLGSAEEVIELVTQSVQDGESAATQYFRTRDSHPLSLADAHQLTLDRNLDVRIQRFRVGQADEGVVASEATFDPVLNYSIRSQNDRNYERVENFTREHEKVIDFEQFEQDFNTIAQGGIVFNNNICVINDGVLLNGQQCESGTEVSPITDFASFETDFQNIWDFAVNASKAFNWGGNLNVNLSSQYERRLSVNLPPFDLAFGPQNPLKTGSRYAWASALRLAFALPTPFSKDFGEFGDEANVALMQSKEESSRRRWDYARLTNDRVRDVHRLYWGTVRTMLQLRTEIRHRDTLAELLGSAKRLFDQGQITQYELAESEADFENQRNRVEQAWGNYFKSSNRLVEFLDLGEVYIVPAAYDEELLETHEVSISPALETAYRERPDLRVVESLVTSADIELNRSKADTRPDIRVGTFYNLLQDNSILGFRDPVHSLENIFRPDKDDFGIGVVYSYPFGNVAVKEVLSEARIRRNQALDDLELTRIRVTKDVNSALADVLSAESRIRLTKSNLKLADLAFQRGKRLRELGLATEFEQLQTFDDLLDAQNDHIDALTEYQSAHAQLAWAQGLLSQKYE